MEITLVGLLVLSGAPASADLYDDCRQEADPRLGDSACSALIEARKYQGQALAEIHFFRGNARAATGRHAEAIVDFDRAIALAGNYAAAYNNRAMAYVETGNDNRAIADLTEALRIDPTLVISYVNRGNILAGRGNFLGAIHDFDEAIAIDPGAGSTYFYRAFAYCRFEKRANAFDDMSRAVDLGAIVPARLQQALKSTGFYKSKPTGKFDSSAKRALKKWISAGCPSQEK